MSKKEAFYSKFGNKIRVRACGILLKEDSILLVKHKNVGEKPEFWAPPGGGVEFGESIEAALIREFKEECGLEVRIEQFLFTTEYINVPLHCYEYFFLVSQLGGVLQTGADPEMDAYDLIENVKFVTFKKLCIMDKKIIHGIFNKEITKEALLNTRGYIKLAR